MLKTLLKVRLAAFAAYFTGASRSQKKRSGAQKIGMLLLMLYCFAAFGMLFYTSFSSLAGVYAKLSLGWLYFAMYAVAAFALMVFGTVFTAKAQLFEAKDNELLLSLPVRPRDILASRMVSLLLWNLLFGLMVAVPALLAWTQAARLPALGFVSFILLLPALACFSLAVTSLLAWALSLLGSRVRNKSLATIIGSVVFLGLYFAVVFRMNSYITQLAQNGAQIAAALSGAKVLVWLGRAMAGESAPALVWSLLATLAPFGLRRLGASPTYLLNSGLGVLFLLAAAVVLVIKRDVILDVLAQMPELASSLPVFLALAIGGMLGMTLFTPSSVSLEGKNLWILQSMPVSGAQVLRAKLRMADLLTLPAAVIASVCCACVTELSPLILLDSVLFARFANVLGLREGIVHAKLDWSNEAQAVKQSWAVMLTMLVCWGVLLAAGAAWLMWLAELVSPEAFLLGFGAVLLFLDTLLLRWLQTAGAERFSRLG